MKTLEGKQFTHPHLGLVLVISKKERSRTIYIVEQIDRGRGWDEVYEKYVGYTVKLKDGVGWARGENKDYGQRSEVHRRELTVQSTT